MNEIKLAFNEPQNFGFVEPVIEPEAYIFGDSQVDLTQPLQLNGQWDDFLPLEEIQNVRNIETANCTAFGSTNQIETYLRRKFGKNYNFSDRALGIESGTFPPGNDPQVVYEKIRKVGLASESLLTFDNLVKSVEDYYDKFKINRLIKDSEQEFLDTYTFKHDWVAFGKLTTPGIMKTALQYSPLAGAIYAFAFDGEYYVRAGKDGDWITITGYEEGKYWKGFTSYNPVIKKFAWDFGFYYVKRINIEKNTVKEQISLIQRILNIMSSLMNLLKAEEAQVPTLPQNVPPSPVLPQIPLLEQFCLAIKEYEGYYKGSRSFRNNNPGNCKYSPIGYDTKYGVVKKDNAGFAIFKDYETGWLYLKNFVKSKAMQSPNQTIFQFISIVYAPASDNNNPVKYAEFVAKRLGISIDYTMKILL